MGGEWNKGQGREKRMEWNKERVARAERRKTTEGEKEQGPKWWQNDVLLYSFHECVASCSCSAPNHEVLRVCHGILLSCHGFLEDDLGLLGQSVQ